MGPSQILWTSHRPWLASNRTANQAILDDNHYQTAIVLMDVAIKANLWELFYMIQRCDFCLPETIIKKRKKKRCIFKLFIVGRTS